MKKKSSPSDQKARNIIEHDLGRTLAVNAGAGSGKTREMVQRILNGTATGVFSMDRIAVITFTRKAAGEMRSRIIAGLNGLLAKEKNAGKRELLETQLVRAVTAQISTIHSFCANILKEKPVEACIDPAFTMLEDGNSDFFDRVFREYMERALSADPAGGIGRLMRTLLHDYDFVVEPSEWGFGNEPSIRGLLETFATHRDAALAMPETMNAKETLAEIKSFFARIISETADTSSLQDKYLSIRDEFLARSGDPEFVVGFGIKAGNTGGTGKKEFRDEVKAGFSDLAVRHYHALRYPVMKELYGDLRELFNDFISFYREREVREGVLDNEDLLIFTRNLLRDNPMMLDYFRGRFTNLFVDEFQDTDPVQTEIIFLLAGERGDCAAQWDGVNLAPGKLFIIGDMKQAIYNFRRADVRSFVRALEIIGANNTVSLTTNFRSRSGVLGFVNCHFSQSMTGDNEYMPVFEALEVSANTRDAGDPAVIAVANPMEPGGGEAVSVDELRELQSLAACRWIAANMGKRFDRWSEVTVLVREKKAITYFQAAFEEAGIPCEAAGSTTYFGRYEVQALATVLAAIADPTDGIAVYGALKGPFFGHGDDELAVFFRGKKVSIYADDDGSGTAKSLALLRELHGLSHRESAPRIIGILYNATGVMPGLAPGYLGRERILNLVKALEFARRKGEGTLLSALDALRAAIDAEIEMGDLSPAPGVRDAVQIMTVHRAKGLENRVVYIADAAYQPKTRKSTLVHDGAIYLSHVALKIYGYDAIKQVNDVKESAEEERLRYVAATRAKDFLVFNHFDVTLKRGNISNGFIQPYYPSLAESGLALREEILIDAGEGDAKRNERYYPDIRPKNTASETKKQEAWDAKFSRAMELGVRPVLEVTRPSHFRGSGGGVSLDVHFADADMVMKVTERRDAPALGTVVHALLEKGHGLDEKKLRRLAEYLIHIHGIDISADEVLGVHGKITGSAMYQRSLRAEKTYRELPLMFVHEGKLVHGVVDLLFLEKGGWVLGDYKVLLDPGSADAEALKKKYKGQMELYAVGLKKMGIEVGEMGILVG